MKSLLEKHPFIFGALLNSLVIAYVMQMTIPAFKTGDDVAMMLRSMGIVKSVDPTPYLLYIHYWFGLLLNWLYKIAYSFPWYGSFILLGVFVFHTTLFGLSFRKYGYRVIIPYVVYIVASGYLIFNELQFTISGMLWALSGLLLLLANLDSKKVFNWEVLVGVLFFVIGAMVRWRGAVMMGVLVIPVFVIMMWPLSDLKKQIKRIIPLSLAFVLAFVMWKIDRSFYNQDPGWEYYRSMNRLRSEIVDYKLLEQQGPEKLIEVLEKVGWSENDYIMLKNWFFMDSSRYNPTNFEEALSMVPRVKDNLPTSYIKEYLKKSLTNPYVMAVLIAVLSVAFLRRKRFKHWLLLLYGPLAFILVSLFIVIYFKEAPERVLFPLSLFSLAIAMPFAGVPPKEAKPSKIQDFLLVVPFILAASLFFSEFRREQLKFKQFEEMSRVNEMIVLDHLVPNDDKLFVVWSAGYPWRSILPFGDLGYLENFRTLSLGSSQQSPDSRSMLEYFEIEDLYRAIAEDDRIWIHVGSKRQNLMENYRSYMLEHYNMKVTWNIIGKAPTYTVYDVNVVP